MKGGALKIRANRVIEVEGLISNLGGRQFTRLRNIFSQNVRVEINIALLRGLNIITSYRGNDCSLPFLVIINLIIN